MGFRLHQSNTAQDTRTTVVSFQSSNQLQGFLIDTERMFSSLCMLRFPQTRFSSRTNQQSCHGRWMCLRLPWQPVTFLMEGKCPGFFTVWHSAGSNTRLQFWWELIACRYLGLSSWQRHRERLMYSLIVEGFDTGAVGQDAVLCTTDLQLSKYLCVFVLLGMMTNCLCFAVVCFVWLSFVHFIYCMQILLEKSISQTKGAVACWQTIEL